MDPQTFKMLVDAGVPSGLLALVLYVHWSNRQPGSKADPTTISPALLLEFQRDFKEVSRLLNELNRASEESAHRRHAEVMEAIRDLKREA